MAAVALQRGVAVLGLVWAVASSVAAPASPTTDPYVPDALKPWVKWVQEGHPESGCTRRHDGGAVAGCAWPGRLELELDAEGGAFSQRWHVEASSWVPLPGSGANWPVEVQIDGAAALVADRDGVPVLHLEPGSYDVTGSFRWDVLPARLKVPDDAAIIRLLVGGEAVANPMRGPDGAVALAAGGPVAGEADRVEVTVFRRLIDERPFRVLTHLSLDVSGAEREIVLPSPFLDGASPLRLEGPLPIRLLPAGRVAVQVRPGRHEFDLVSRFDGKLDVVRRGAVEPPLPVDEVWSFDARRSLRDVRPQGLPPVDPRQTRMPPAWRELPAFVAGPDAELELVPAAGVAGVPPRDALSLDRDLWLDFDGGGYTARDRIDGIAHADRRLETDLPLTLGRVEVNGEPRVITRLEPSGPHGFEVRAGSLAVVAESRIEAGDVLPVSGWNRDLDSVATTLHLPPGWRLAAAPGAARAAGAWLQRWTALDMFMVLVLSVAIWRVFGVVAGGLALLALVLTWHDPGAPRYLWAPAILLGALVGVLTGGRLRSWISALRLLAATALIVVAVPYLVDTVRLVVYPQLEHGEDFVSLPTVLEEAGLAAGRIAGKALAPAAAPPPQSAALEKLVMADAVSTVAIEPPARPSRPLDTALVPTGPGVPEWRWNNYRLEWDGPVGADREQRLMLLSPSVNRALDLARFLFGTLLLGVVVANRRRVAPPRLSRGMAAALVAAAMVPFAGGTGRAEAADFPPPALLDELAARLIGPPQCAPNCLDLSSVLVTADEREIHVYFELTALGDIAAPLLAASPSWSPDRVEVDGQPAAVLGASGEALVALEEGHRLVEIAGPVGMVDEVQLSFPIRPHRLAVESSTWRSSGMERAGGDDRQLRLFRTLEPAPGDSGAPPESALVEPFFEITRTLVLGVDARVVNQVARLSDPRVPVSLEVPLLPGEAPLTGVTVAQGAVRVALAAGQTVFRWESVLDLASPLTLAAPEVKDRVERWRLDADARWHTEYEGVAPVVAGGEGGPVKIWRPWPGQRLALVLLKPEGVAGDTLTIDRSRLHLVPGGRSTRARFVVDLRSSRGGAHSLFLPEGVTVESLRLDGEVQPIEPGRREISIPLKPGTRHVELQWLAEGGMETVFRTPPLDLGAPSVNAAIELVPDRGRWLLWLSGPRLGPAILYWGLLLASLAAAIALSRIEWVPVRWWEWFLLGAGLSYGHLWLVAPVLVWFLLVGHRRRLSGQEAKATFNFTQVGIVVLTPLFLAALVEAVRVGLLGNPDMQVAGNQSGASSLIWFADRVDGTLPVATAWSVPLAAYRVVMLAWALWLAFTLLRWLRWAWGSFSAGGTWRRIEWRRRSGTDSA